MLQVGATRRCAEWPIRFELLEPIAFGPPVSEGRIAGYRIDEDQSGSNGTILQPVFSPMTGSGHERPKGDVRVESVRLPTADIGRRGP